MYVHEIMTETFCSCVIVNSKSFDQIYLHVLPSTSQEFDITHEQNHCCISYLTCWHCTKPVRCTAQSHTR